ncbi:hypothetical protein K431DRAFT_236584 [Polychaeton citri CBS 116435]|uniref:DUF1279 domain-containing protein n=1 Tax=Polychaeton citri CBS 116435 TaxID=1314669 RepID=A0A9P4UJN7_9PEZI|nr:hypothetical protein K431DRAFT_236584 [Polychaeton citri CBS 116435]
MRQISRFSHNCTPTNSQLLQRLYRPRLPRPGKDHVHNNVRPRANHNSTNTHLNGPKPLSFSERMKKLSREYGYAALGVYLGLSAIDLPLCYLGVSWAGADKVAAVEHWVVERFWQLVEIALPNIRAGDQTAGGDAGQDQSIQESMREGDASWGADKAQAKSKGIDASFWAQFALAYAIHKSFIFIRVPLTAAITPKVVKKLRSWGWNIGKAKPKPVKTE